MKHVILKKGWDRVSIAKQDSDTSYFYSLLFIGEMLTKIVVAGMVAAIKDDRERHRYRILHRLVRSDGLGDWVRALNDALTGPASSHLIDDARVEQADLTQKFKGNNWQFDAVQHLKAIMNKVNPNHEVQSASKVSVSMWFNDFVVLRNKTRGHGATTSADCSVFCPHLETSIDLLCNNLKILKRPWAYLHRNYSGKYRVVRLGGNTDCYNYLKASKSHNLLPGVYIDYTEHCFVDLISTDVDTSDFFFPNGGFNDSKKTFEIHSYLTDDRNQMDAKHFLSAPGILPSSETEGLGSLNIFGEKTWANLPPKLDSYVSRPELEQEVMTLLTNNRHPVITLMGRGGIGKTSLALQVLYDLSKTDCYESILWFSARDLDLLPEKPKLVTPKVLSQNDISNLFVELMEPKERTGKKFKPTDYFEKSLSLSPTGKPFLFVFDNFETVRNPNDLFHWIDTHLRLPNKVLITTRYRNFKADYPVEISGMSESEANELMTTVSTQLGIQNLLTKKYRADAFSESDGHPYVLKVLLGEIVKSQKTLKIERIIGSNNEMLNALFERTYARLSPAAKRVFLTLCNWKSLVPQLALEAVLLRPQNERMDTGSAIEELYQSSFVEFIEIDETSKFINVPLVAFIFGHQKLEVSNLRHSIQLDTDLLQYFGATQTSGTQKGIHPRIRMLFSHVSTVINNDIDKYNEFQPILEYVCGEYPPAWLMLSDLCKEIGDIGFFEKAKEYARRLIARKPKLELQREGWSKLAKLSEITSDSSEEISALVGLCNLPDTSVDIVSNAINRVNLLLRSPSILDSSEKQIMLLDLIEVMESKYLEFDANDASRLSWLYLHVGNEIKAREWVNKGLTIDDTNIHCLNLDDRLNNIYP
jgi:hypothetical protein